jgi:hypothetical protein
MLECLAGECVEYCFERPIVLHDALSLIFLKRRISRNVERFEEIGPENNGQIRGEDNPETAEDVLARDIIGNGDKVLLHEDIKEEKCRPAVMTNIGPARKILVEI